MDFRDRSPDDSDADAGGTTDTFPDPREADPIEVERYNQAFLEANPDVGVDASAPESSATMDTPFAKQDAVTIDGADPNWKAKFPWLYDPSKGRRWDFDPVELRVLSQENAWVQMMVQSITKEIAETSWTITTTDDARETDKRINTHPDERAPIEKDLPDATAERIYEDLRRPVPHLDWSDAVEMWLRDYLEVGSMVANKVFDERYYGDDGELNTDPSAIEPLALQPTAPEVWTKDYGDQSGIPQGYWQFARRSSPGATQQASRGVGDPTHFDRDEVMWSDNSPATNRAYGSPPTLNVSAFIRSLGLAVDQEQNYLSRGSIPSGAWVFEEWDREEVLEWKANNAENLKGKPHKSMMFAGRGGDVRFEPMSMNFKELEFTERMKWYARVVASAFQVPTAVVGIEPEKVNYNTFQGERENFETNTLGPYLQDFERWLNHGWMDHFDGYRFEFTPGMSETTRQMRSERIRQEWNANLRPREGAARELGIDLPEDAEDGFKSEVVEGGEQNDDLGALMASVTESDSGNSIRRDATPEGVPSNATRVADESECGGSTVEGPRGGTYCVPEGADGVAASPEDARQEVRDIVASASSDAEAIDELNGYLESATGAESVDLSNFDAERATEISEATAALAAVGETDNLNGINSSPTDEMRARDSAGNYDPFSREITLNPDKLTDDKIEEWSDSGYLAGGSIQHIVTHEIGHHRHFQKQVDGQSAGMQAQTQEIPGDAREAFAEQVSVYAAENANEMVAELYAMKVSGDEFTTGMDNAYEAFNGPEVNV